MPFAKITAEKMCLVTPKFKSETIILIRSKTFQTIIVIGKKIISANFTLEKQR